MNYSEIRKINVNEHVEKKNGLTYLSWAWAVDQMLSLDPEASWEYPEPKTWGETVMVFCTVTMFGKKRTAQLPVMDYKNKAIANPDAFAVNTAMQRCLAKAISLHGLGLYIYAGEDVPPDAVDKLVEDATNANAKPTAGAMESLPEDVQTFVLDAAFRITSLWSKNDIKGAWDEYESAKKALEIEGQAALRATLESKVKTALRKHSEALKEAA